jgi:two-component system, NtrC family, response regulator AtoC
MTKLTPSVLLVDDDPAVGKVLAALLRQEGIESHEVDCGAAALAALELQPFDVVIADLRMPNMDGLELLSKIIERWPDQAFVMLTAHGTLAAAVEAMKLGAQDFLVKPFDGDQVVAVVRRALTVAKRDAHAIPAVTPTPAGLLGTSPAMREVLTLVERAARTSSTVLIRGESGTGKELAARAIHDLSTRSSGPFIKFNCAALPDALLESELFGYEKGAFTGATARKPGRVELAHGGTLFLDEIGDMSPNTQVKLLRVLQEREFERLGGTQLIKVDVRFVAATHRDLEESMRRREFREDLFYRLNVLPIRMPALRERPEDVELLAKHFCEVHAIANGRSGVIIDRAALVALDAEPWPGNVRQLQNFVERLIVMSDGPRIGEADVVREFARERSFASQSIVNESDRIPQNLAAIELHRRESERQALLSALTHARNNRTVAARILGISRRTLYNRLQDHGMS